MQNFSQYLVIHLWFMRVCIDVRGMLSSFLFLPNGDERRYSNQSALFILLQNTILRKENDN